MFSTSYSKASFLFAVLLITAFSEGSPHNYKKEATTLCALFEVTHLKKLLSKPGVDGFKEVALETRKIVKSEALKAIFSNLSSSTYRNYYTALQPKISQLIGEEWHCENMKKFYDITWTRSDIPQDPSGENKTVKLSITPKGFIKINEELFDYKTTNTIKTTKAWKQKLTAYIAKERPWLVKILVPENLITEDDVKPLIAIFEKFNIDANRYSFQQYRVSEFEALKK